MKRINSKTGWLIVGLLFVVGITYKIFWERYRDSVLTESRFTWAIVTRPVHCSSKGGCDIEYKFYDTKHELVFSEYGRQRIQECHDKLGVGDTVYIRYAISDPEVTEMVHCYWNDKIRSQWEKKAVSNGLHK